MSAGGAVAATLVLASGVVAGALAAFVWTRRAAVAGTALAVLLVAVAFWNIAYAAELFAEDDAARLVWGNVKYVGIGAMAPAWVAFVLAYTGRGSRVRPRLLAALAVEPVALIAVLVLPGTAPLVRWLPPDAPDHAAVQPGPLFWVHAVYTATVMVGAAALFVVSLVRRSRAYWLQAAALVAAAVAPLVANLLFNLGPPPFDQLDLSPVLFTVSGLVLAWGLFRQRLLRLAPVARGVLVETMTDPVLVLDVYGHVVDVNPAAARLLDARAERLVGRAGRDVLPAALIPAAAGSGSEVTEVRVALIGAGERTFEVQSSPLPGRRGRPGGRLLVLRDVTDRSELESRLRLLLAEQRRVAEALSLSLRPADLPAVPGLELACGFRPAGGGREIGGDFFDVFQAGDEWAFVLGDVSGKGARAAAATASARHALRALAPAEPSPAVTLARLDSLLAGQLGEDVYLTAVHGRVRAGCSGATVRLSLGGHARPLVVGGGRVRAVGDPGSAIGLTGAPELTDTELRLGPGEALVLTTDGVTEARRDGEFFGDAGLEECLARQLGAGAEAIADGILEEVLAFQRGDAADDIAILVLAVPALPPERATIRA